MEEVKVVVFLAFSLMILAIFVFVGIPQIRFSLEMKRRRLAKAECYRRQDKALHDWHLLLEGHGLNLEDSDPTVYYPNIAGNIKTNSLESFLDLSLPDDEKPQRWFFSLHYQGYSEG